MRELADTDSLNRGISGSDRIAINPSRASLRTVGARRARFAGQSDELDRFAFGDLKQPREDRPAFRRLGFLQRRLKLLARLGRRGRSASSRSRSSSSPPPGTIALDHRPQRRDVIPADPPRQLHQLAIDQHALVIDRAQRFDLRISVVG